jgi:hypothetical protein
MVIAEQIRQGKRLAEAAGREMYNKIGERDACGFGWVEVYVDRTNSAQAKELIAAGFKKDYKPKCLSMWDPAGIPTQSISVKEAGAEAYAEYLRALGLRAFAGSRLD